MGDFVDSFFNSVSNVVDSVASAVGDVVQAAVDNPILTVAAIATAQPELLALDAAVDAAVVDATLVDAGLTVSAEADAAAALAIAEGSVPYSTVGLVTGEAAVATGSALVEGANAVTLATDTSAILRANELADLNAAFGEELASGWEGAVATSASQNAALEAATASPFTLKSAVGLLDQVLNVGTKALTLQHLLNPKTGKTLQLPLGATIPLGFMPTGKTSTVFTKDPTMKTSGLDAATLMPDDGKHSRLWLYLLLGGGVIFTIWGANHHGR